MKEFLVWRDAWNTGIPDIDAQHRAMARQLNVIAVALACGGHSTPDLGELLHELLRRTREHFAYEEALMLEMKYSGYAAHKSEHAMLTGELSDVIECVENRRLDCDMNMLRSLKQWFVGHIVQADSDYVRFRRTQIP